MSGLFGVLRFPSPSTLALYLATVIAEVPVIIARTVLTFAVIVLVLLIKGEPLGGAQGLAEIALIPTGWSVLALMTPFGGGWWWAQNMGGRDPSQRERLAYQDAVEHLQAQATGEGLRLPGFWFVVDEPLPDAAVCGNTLMLSRGLLESEYLPAVLAHELGHLHSSDGKLTAAINRLIINPLPKTHEKQPAQQNLVVASGDKLLLTITMFGAALWVLRLIVRFAQGGLGLRIMAPGWGSYWRQREYTADQHAARLGQAEELADFLETHALIHDHPVPFIWLTEHTHPPTELRIDKLRNTPHEPIINDALPAAA
jgi:Zn-dependent protease with chaperone function